MKSIISNGSMDFIIEEAGTPIFGEDRAYMKGEVAGTVKQSGVVKNICMFIGINNPYDGNVPTFVRLYLTAEDIKKLHAKVEEVEAKRFDAEYDELPW